MLKICYIFLITVTSVNSYSQDSISLFKEVAYRIVEQKFTQAQLKNVKCECFTTYLNNNSESFYPSYDMFSDVTESFSKVEFTFSLFSDKIGDKIDFYITIDKDKKVENEGHIFKGIPKCFIDGNDCGFIKRDSAIKLAIQDKIEFPGNFQIQFVKQKNTNIFYWVIESYPAISQKSRRSARKSGQNQRRTINASSGNITSWKQFNESK